MLDYKVLKKSIFKCHKVSHDCRLQIDKVTSNHSLSFEYPNETYQGKNLYQDQR